MDRVLKIPSVTGVDVALRLAGPGGRSYAFIVDWHIRVLLAGAWFFAASFAYIGSGGPAGFVPSQSGFAYIVAAPGLALYFLYHPVLEVAMRGRTPGKRIAGVRIVRRDGGMPGAGALLIRNLFRPLDSLPLLYCIGLATTMATRHAVRIGDIAAGTLLVYDDPARKTAFENLSSGGVERLGLGRAELARDLLGRWNELKPDVRASLAQRLLSSVGAGTEPEHDEAALRAELEALLR